MDEFRLIIYVIILFVSVISIISNSNKKRKNKKKAEEILQGITSHRNITEQELSSLRDLYKRNGEITDYQVFEVEGEYSFTEIRTKGSSIKTHFINFIEVLWLPQLDNLVQTNNKAEIVFNSKGKAIVLSFNDKYSVTEESSFKELLKGEATLSSSDSGVSSSTVTSANRSLTDIEIDYINSDVRVLAGLFLFLAALVPIINSSYIALGVSTLFLIVSYFLYKKPKSSKHNNNSRLIKLTGKVTKVASGQFVLDRYTLFFPKNHQPELDVETDVEAYSLDDNGLNNKVLSQGTEWSINREYQFKPVEKKGKKIFLIVVILIALIIYLLSGAGENSVRNSIKFITSYGAKTDFNSLQELQDYDIKLGQKINIYDVMLVPKTDRSSHYIVEEPLNIDISEVEKRLNTLYEIQHTYLFYQLVAVFIVDYEDEYNFENDYYNVVNDKDLEEFREAFKENESYIYLADFWPRFQNGEVEPDYDKLEQHFNNFFDIEAEKLNTMLQETITNSLNSLNKIELKWIVEYGNNIEIDGQKIRVFTLDYYSNIEYKDNITYLDFIGRYQAIYNNPNKTTISGEVLTSDPLRVSDVKMSDPLVDFYISFLLLILLLLIIKAVLVDKSSSTKDF